MLGCSWPLETRNLPNSRPDDLPSTPVPVRSPPPLAAHPCDAHHHIGHCHRPSEWSIVREPSLNAPRLALFIVDTPFGTHACHQPNVVVALQSYSSNTAHAGL